MSRCRMHSHRRSRARQSAVLAISFLFLSLMSVLEAACATIFTVGDSSRWDFNVGNWTDGITSSFNYDPSLHYVAVDLNASSRCSFSGNSRTCTSGKDRIMVSKGNHYFLCSYPSHCDEGLKIAISAS